MEGNLIPFAHYSGTERKETNIRSLIFLRNGIARIQIKKQAEKMK